MVQTLIGLANISAMYFLSIDYGMHIRMQFIQTEAVIRRVIRFLQEVMLMNTGSILGMERFPAFQRKWI